MTHHVECVAIRAGRACLADSRVRYLDVEIRFGSAATRPARVGTDGLRQDGLDGQTDRDDATRSLTESRPAAAGTASVPRARWSGRRRPTRSSGSTRSRARASTSTRCRTASRCCWRTCCAPRTARTSPPTTSGRSPAGTPTPSPSKEIQFTPGPRDHAGLHRRARASSTSPPCARRWPTSAATRPRSTRSRRPSWSSTTP